MKKMFSNATVYWTEQEIVERDCLIQQCYQIVRSAWTGINRQVRFCRVETPILTPAEVLAQHVAAGFPMLDTKHGILRPETTAGCIAAFHDMYPMASQRAKQLPFCVWQVGKSFRDEKQGDTMRATKLRLREFWHLEFELFAAGDTKADYLVEALAGLVCRFGGNRKSVPKDDLPHYSRRTVDWMFAGLEVAGCSERTDWSEGVIYEISIGLDRLCVSQPCQ